MNVLVLVSGIADPKWPLPSQLDAAALQAHTKRHAVLSPFDQAALELALKLRDADPAVAVKAVVVADEAMARHVAGFRLAAVHRVEPEALAGWDAMASAASLAQAVAALAREADVILVGREFGDLDDGSVPPLLARALGVPHVSLAFAVAPVSGALSVLRQRGPALERLRLHGPAVLSVTNDVKNRLRHPLLKNVMAARKLQFSALEPVQLPIRLKLAAVVPSRPAVRQAACRMLEGTPQEQARLLAEELRNRRAAS